MFDTTWFKTTGLAAVQAAAHAALGCLGIDTVGALVPSINVLRLDWLDLAGLSGGAAFASVCFGVVAYRIPSVAVTEAVSVSAAAVDLKAANALPDACGARG